MITLEIKSDLMVHAKGEGQMGGSPGVHIGTVDNVDGNYIKLKKNDSADGRHHWIPLSWVDKTDSKTVYLNKTQHEVINGLLNEKPEDFQKAS